MPRVSVIITTYNQARYLRTAIESVLAQSLTPAEVIVVDDGSTDAPEEVVANFPSIDVIRQPNGGLASARNTGLRSSTSPYVVFLDADDRLLPQALAVNIETFTENPGTAFVFGNYGQVDVDGRPVGELSRSDIGEDAYECLLMGNCVGMHGTVMYRRDQLEEVGGFDVSLRACEDYDMYLRLTRRYPVGFSSHCLAEYRQHDGNLSNDIPLMLDSALGVLRRQRSELRGNRRLRSAYSAGLRDWKSYYARQQLIRARTLVREDRRGLIPALRDVLRVFRLAPLTALWTAASAGLKAVRARIRSSPGPVSFGSLRRISPISPNFGFDRGMPIDRRFIEHFLSLHASDIHGRVLEVGDRAYTVRFGGTRVTRSEVLHVTAGYPGATLIGDLADTDGLPASAFDCIVLTQTLHLVFDLRAGVASLEKLLSPGGVLLVTVPGVSGIDRGEWGPSWYWSLTSAALQRLLEEQFRGEDTTVTAYGNVLTAVAFLHGLADAELNLDELDTHDPNFPVIVAGRAVKRAEHADVMRLPRLAVSE